MNKDGIFHLVIDREVETRKEKISTTPCVITAKGRNTDTGEIVYKLAIRDDMKHENVVWRKINGLMKKNGVLMPRPSKLTSEIQQKIGENVSLGLTYSLAASAAGVTYQSFNQWMSKGKTEKSGKYYQFYKCIQKCNADAAKVLLERLNDAAKAGDTRICTWILERRFPEDFGRREYRKMNVISENLNQNVELIVNDADGIRKQILEKFAFCRENREH